jgi:hypothetical protein
MFSLLASATSLFIFHVAATSAPDFLLRHRLHHKRRTLKNEKPGSELWGYKNMP